MTLFAAQDVMGTVFVALAAAALSRRRRRGGRSVELARVILMMEKTKTHMKFLIMDG